MCSSGDLSFVICYVFEYLIEEIVLYAGTTSFLHKSLPAIVNCA
jgi:hypothetical protein